MGFVDFIGEAVEVSTYIEPGVQVSDDKELILTMTYCAEGFAPE
jgi:hypothetical protein